MSAIIPPQLPIKELIKHTGYECESSERAVCALSGKLRAWVREDGDILYTHAELPLIGENYYYGSTELGHIDVSTFESHVVITTESIKFTDTNIYHRNTDLDISI